MNISVELSGLFVLGLAAVCDIRKMEIPRILIVIEFFIGLISTFIQLTALGFPNQNLSDCVVILWDLLPGGLLLVTSYLSGEKIGYGDGLLVVTLGLILGSGQVLIVLAIAFGASSLTSIVLLAAYRCKKTARIPFVPFLFLGYLVMFLARWIELK